jgi:NADP-dependent 3-hydroxy acid dehydrogenase YdfG
MRSLLRLSAVVLLVSALLWVVERQTFRVHDAGAVLNTGCSSGIGRHAAVGLSGRGFTVFGTVRTERDAGGLVSECPRCVPLIMDVADDSSILAGVERFRRVGTET